MKYLLALLLCFSTTILSAQVFDLLAVRAETTGNEILLRATETAALRDGLLNGMRLEADDGSGWRAVGTVGRRFADVSEAQATPLGPGEGRLYRYVVYGDTRAGTDSLLLVGVYRRLAEDRAGLLKTALLVQDPTGLPTTKYRLLAAAGGAALSATAPLSSLRTRDRAPEIVPQRNSQRIELQWPRDDMAGYYVYKSVGGKTERIGGLTAYRDPGASASPAERNHYSLLDSLPPDGRTYTYRLVALDPFGRLYENIPEATIVGRDLVAPPMPVTEPAVVNAKTNECRLRWRYEKGETPATVRLLFSPKAQETFQPVATLPPTATEWTERWPDDRNRGFYRLEIVDAAGNTTTTNEIFALRPDIIPPALPTGLTAELNDSIVTLRWEPLDEKDVGYRLRARSAGNDYWTEIMRNAPADNTYRDSLRARLNGGTMEYQLAAYDWIGNDSDFGPTLTVELPDEVPPAAPVLTGLRAVEDSIGLGWAQAEDVAVILVEIAKGDDDFGTLQRIMDGREQLLLTGQQPGRYRFRLRAEDAAGNLSAPSAVRRVVVRKAAEELTVGLNRLTHRAGEDGRVLLSWQPTDDRPSTYLIYRQLPGGESVLAGTTTTASFSDLAMTGTRYFVVRQGLDGQAFGASEVYEIQ